MKKIFASLTAGYLMITTPLLAINIIPQPADVKTSTGVFKLTTTTTINAGSNIIEAAQLRQFIHDASGLDLLLKVPSKNNSIDLVSDEKLKKELGEEGYLLVIKPDNITITAATSTGIFYGIQSLRQLINRNGNTYTLNAVSIKDKPRFVWRAFMLDEGRYFKGSAVVKRLLDEMAFLKMNTFHWHLTDDQGWRIEIRKYPKLTTIGSHRDSTQIGGDADGKIYDGKPHGGFYSQEEIKEIIRYAAERHITVIPEIEMPGHSAAAIAAYPWLGTSPKPIRVPCKFGIQYDVYNIADPKVIAFLHDVLDEIINLFPSKVIHIGGDEVRYDHWKTNPGIQAYMKEHHIASPGDLQIAFTNGISNFLSGKHRRMAGWNEIMNSMLDRPDGGNATNSEKLAPSTIIQFWTGNLKIIDQAVSKGYDVVNSFNELTYLDYSYKDISLEKAYSFDPIPEGLDPKYHAKILGTGCQMWGEWIPDEGTMNKQVYPRLAAYAEDGWTLPANKNFGNFHKALEYFNARWNVKWDIN